MIQTQLDYLLSHHSCAYCQILPKQLLTELGSLPHHIELEHIFQRLGKRIDHPDNYVVTCRPCHQWKHQNSSTGRVAALYWKLINHEFNNLNLSQLTGFNVLGWIQNQHHSLPQWAQKLAQAFQCAG